jgi:L-alanine-DL-glutamate epimerase-like enolase superfamily enzyme
MDLSVFPNNVRIERVQTTVFRLPLRGALRWGKHSTLAEARHVLVRIHLSDGSMGMAEAPPRPTIYGETASTICAVIAEEITPRVLAQPLSSVPMRVQELKFNHTAKGAFDIALYDAVAKSRGQSLGALLGGSNEPLRISYILGMGSADEVMAEAARVANAGVRVLKVKVGREPAADLALIDTLQQALGPTVQMYADANECLSTEAAPRTLAALRERGLLYCEEPLPVELVHERASLRAQEIVPLIGDDSAFTARDLAREIALDTFDILNIKTARTGYTESEQMRRLALAAGKGIMVGSQASAGLGAARAGLFAARPGIEHPSELTFFLKLEADIIPRPIPIVDGCIRPADLDAVQVDNDLLRDFAV